MIVYQTIRRWGVATVVAIIGVTWNFYSLSLIERSITTFPPVTDIFMNLFPRVDFGWFGELGFFVLILLFAVPHFWKSWRATPDVLLALGLMYFIRGWFMFLFPIGPPLGSVGADARLSIWGHETHAYFPGGHIAVITVLAMFTSIITIRRLLWVGAVMIGIGTLLAKNHYTMDSVTGIIIGYAVSVWVQRRLSNLPAYKPNMDRG